MRRVLVAIDVESADPNGASSNIIDGYVIERELGRGAGGVTYLASKQASHAHVALKVLHAVFGQGPDDRRAWRELDLLQQIRSPNVPRLLDFGVTGHSLYVATEFVEGAPLSRRFQTATPADLDDLRTRVTLLARLAAAAHTLHELGVIHRDLKPSNVIIAAGDEPFIIDLGIALLISPDPMQTLTTDGTPVGTPAFMAPEQARGERSLISTRSDVYALGAIGLWLLTGQTPHDLTGATLHEAVRRVGSDQPRSPRAIAPRLPKALSAVLAKACAMRPADRYGSASELAADLRRYLDGRTVEATAPGLWRACTDWAAHHPALLTTALCAVIALGTLGGTALVQWHLSFKPFAVRLDTSPSPKWAQLVSASGRVLHSWRADEGGGILHADLVDESVWDRPVVVTNIQRPLGAPDRATRLCVWDARKPDELLWSADQAFVSLRAPRVNLPPLTSADYLATGDVFSIGQSLLADIFPESPGLELLILHPHFRFDPTAIRIYTLKGEVLFEAWHWGGVEKGVRWLGETRSLVCTGTNNEAPWEALGHPGFEIRWPRVLFSFQPQFGQMQGWLNPRMARAGEDADWYRCLWPPQANDLYRMRLESAAPNEHAPGVVHVMIEDVAGEVGYCVWTVDPDGQLRTAVYSDAARNLGDQFLCPTLADLPDLPAPPPAENSPQP
ncbi:MAG: serine/threonine protein kinase [Phycisphaerales bacterium]|nr:serine/threonine protein kinase [Phycisphaerales bacterium]